MEELSTALVALIVLGSMAATGPALYAQSLMQVENTALGNMGQVEDNITKPLNYGEEHINNSIELTEGYYINQAGTARIQPFFLYSVRRIETVIRG